MALFVKKVGGVSFYEINGIRAAGIVPYYIKGGKVKILINREIRNNKIVFNCIGGKVEKRDRTIEETAEREFNEETGYIASDLIRQNINDSKNIKLYLKKSKYITTLINVGNDIDWNLLPYNYDKIFKDVEVFNDRDSLDLKWIDLFKFKQDNKSYLLTLILYNIRNHKKFQNLDPEKEPLFLED
jgi:8-oxo-dGTP pyrophosphatase MutT (NUDIX family)